MSNYFDIYTVGVGGQGLLTISDIITQAAADKGIGVNFFPTKGMAQRGGFVKTQLRLGREAGSYSPSISPGGADLIVSMELSETLKAVRYGKRGADYVILGLRWQPTAVMLGKAPYPDEKQVVGEIRENGGVAHYFAPEAMPDGARANIYMLGAAHAHSRLNSFFSKRDMEKIITESWKSAAQENIEAFRAGCSAPEKDIAV
ncbi:MAG: 2-oxoacid:acceptor oxidoreductase family protein [Synergistaceae bacterium]|jgi:indolepyruvate ferredoxin oxidoreductase beta subunit|nr:2-oxoacid:acceptor oxidoreductase family protein [Synergistaceae bacterium]